MQHCKVSKDAAADLSLAVYGPLNQLSLTCAGVEDSKGLHSQTPPAESTACSAWAGRLQPPALPHVNLFVWEKG